MTTNGIYSWHEKSWRHAIHARRTGHLPHALLLSGEPQTGKRRFANRLVKSLLCESPILAESGSTQAQGACGQCHSCKTYESGANPDYLQVDLAEDKQQISVDQIRAMNDFLNLSRSFKGQRVVLVSEAERMSLNAANSLLKSLEEPADNSVIILLTSQISSLLATIRSRCQIMLLPTPDRKQILDWLKNHPENNKIDPSDIHKNIQHAIQLSQGRPLAALDLLTSNKEIIANRAALLKDIVEIVMEHISLVDVAKKWQKHEREALLNWQLDWVQQLLKFDVLSVIKTGEETGHQSLDESRALETLRENIFSPQLWGLYDHLLRQKQLIHTSVNPLIFIENMLVLWLQAKHCQ